MNERELKAIAEPVRYQMREMRLGVVANLAGDGEHAARMLRIAKEIDSAHEQAFWTAARTLVGGMHCYRNFCSGLGPNEADGDDDFEEYCHRAGYRQCPRCRTLQAIDNIKAGLQKEAG